ncbi:glycosyltransferase [Aquipuribacter sp. SD81]|uniref:glycosyltransferase n=1 Tax=Aquipuribacter sp. SD81 TaxID=3127703 RepID=UPI00301ADFA7
MSGRDARVRVVGVVVPARDEERLLGRCLRALGDAVRLLTVERPDVRARVVVVLDGCLDDSAGVVARAPWPEGADRPVVLTTRPRGVGAARAAGAADALEAARTAGVEDHETWLAGTDADSAVPPQWLLAQVAAAERGADAWVGTVVLPGGGLSGLWGAQQEHREGHAHVHGANLGVRASAYLAAGGYPPLSSGEDVALVDGLAGTGARLVRTARWPVLTSDRLVGRAPDGVAADLRELSLETDGAA